MNRLEAYQLIKQAIREYYDERQWLLIMLKNSWTTEGNPEYNSRDQLRISEYATLELTQYNGQPQVQVYIGLSPNHIKRPKWISTVIDPKLGYNHIRSEVHGLLNSATYELQQLVRGQNHSITLHNNEVYDVSNQLSN